MKNTYTDTNTKGNAILIIVVILAVMGGAGWWLLSSHEAGTAPMNDAAMMEENGGNAMEGSMMMEATGDIEGSSAMMEATSDAGVMMEATSAGSYEIYTPEKLAAADAGEVVLFFHASWCPTCRAADASITETGVPDGLTILKLNYDTETELRKQYGVTVQHTFVQVDSQGNLIKKWTGSQSAAAIAATTI